MAWPSGFVNYADSNCVNDIAVVFRPDVVVDFVAQIVQISFRDLRDQATDAILRSEHHQYQRRTVHRMLGTEVGLG
jgi:hypothetical protein